MTLFTGHYLLYYLALSIYGFSRVGVPLAKVSDQRDQAMIKNLNIDQRLLQFLIIQVRADQAPLQGMFLNDHDYLWYR